MSFFVEAVFAGLLVETHGRVVHVTDPRNPWDPNPTVSFSKYGPLTSYDVRFLLGNKHLTSQLLRQAGIPTPIELVVLPDDEEAAERFAWEVGWPVVVKPVRQNRGTGLTVGVSDRDALAHALAKAGRHSRFVLVQKTLDGPEYRVLATRTSVIAAYTRDPAHVVGDGVRNVKELVEAKNNERMKHRGVGTSSRRIRLGDVAKDLLSQAGMSEESVPSPGQRVALHRAANVHLGADTIAVTSELDPSIGQLATAAVRAIPGCRLSGIDIILPAGHQVDIASQAATVLEMNFHAGFRGHLHPVVGPSVNVHAA